MLMMTPEATAVMDDDVTFDTKGAAAYIGCSEGYLKKLRGTGDGPRYRRLFVRKGIQYRRRDINAWLSMREYGSTTEYPESFR